MDEAAPAKPKKAKKAKKATAAKAKPTRDPDAPLTFRHRNGQTVTIRADHALRGNYEANVDLTLVDP